MIAKQRSKAKHLLRDIAAGVLGATIGLVIVLGVRSLGWI